MIAKPKFVGKLLNVPGGWHSVREKRFLSEEAMKITDMQRNCSSFAGWVWRQNQVEGLTKFVTSLTGNDAGRSARYTRRLLSILISGRHESLGVAMRPHSVTVMVSEVPVTKARLKKLTLFDGVKANEGADSKRFFTD